MTHKFTAGDLKRLLSGLDDETEISFSGDLTFYRFKRWSDNEVLIEFNEAQAATSDRFRRQYPGIQVCFCKAGEFENL
ncbi:hypothetical protein [Pantoea ananatis]|uniref:hypothetical protein n=1 Tax=Pantoea ananas TaxID=553 RepID=UPI0021E8A1DE|nr:hypothetical protein [Pantoea ananatis]MCW0309998.1 hypothetical protein [Pantoea ananatis]MCW0341708.1 hypothetical protein [Pantoea ananatis]MCW0360227.1 hypothetical protein [Pantoea ananatis]MCW0364854.1 hypothetical protein [Pantoea ananatis]MCW1777445.1 hypothetical protein [Pantoea ananatis]